MGLCKRLATTALLFLHIGLGSASKKVSVKEVVFDSVVSDIQWLGEDQKTVLTLTSKGRLYRSTNGGETWNDITDFFKTDAVGGGAPEPFVASSLTKSPCDQNTILASGNKRTNYISNNKGATWKRIRQRSQIHKVLFHPTRPTWMLMSTWTSTCNGQTKQAGDDGPCNHQLYISQDLGKTFRLLQGYVVMFNWGTKESNQQDSVYFSHFRSKKGDQPRLYMWSKDVDFATMDVNGRRPKTLVPGGNKFLVSHGFIFVATVKDVAGQTVTLKVSANGGKTFSAAQLPMEIDEKSYTILDTSEGIVMLHVNHGNKEAQVGNVYISDAEGYRFTLSLPNNVRGNGGDCEFDKVLSLEGVYMANFKDIPRAGDSNSAKGDDKNSEDSNAAQDIEEAGAAGTEVDKRRVARAKAKSESIVRSVISFDKGGVWSYLKPPKVDSLGKQIECPPDRCWLHLHGVTNSNNYAPFYSIGEAVGIIMGTGNVGPYLRFEQDQVNTFISRDGGLTWLEAHKGAFIYEYGDHGGLVVMADDIAKTKLVVFSWNEGLSWYDFELSSLPIEVDNVVTEPNATSTKFLLYGTRGDTGVMYHLDFETLQQPTCKGVWAADSASSDYETWSPSDGKSTEKCLMGKQVTYTRRKPTSECFNGERFERPSNQKTCECTQEDFECEVGFTRKVGSMECKFADDGSLPVPVSCKRESYFTAKAYRKVVGDSCEGGWSPSFAQVPCPPKPMSKGAWSVLGSFGMLAGIMAAVTWMTNSEKVKGVFSNYGFDGYTGIKYAGLGAKNPESALDSVGMRFDADFIEDDKDEFDAPQLMSFNNGGERDRDRDRDRDDRRRDDDRKMRNAGLESASAAAVPKLAKPPGAASNTGAPDDEVDLL